MLQTITQHFWTLVHHQLGFFKFSGRIGRLTYLTLSTVWLSLLFWPIVIMKQGTQSLATLVGISSFYIAILFHLILIKLRRVKDFAPAKWSFPIYIALDALFPILLLIPGEKTDNIYGNKLKERVFVLWGKLGLAVAWLVMSIYLLTSSPALIS